MNKPNIWVFSLEPLETRYTCEWLNGIPDALAAHEKADEFNIRNVLGKQVVSTVSEGGFLNFADTNYWKSTQLIEFLDAYNRGETTTNDRFLFTDFWNTSAIQIKYMQDLMGKNWQLHGICHAGAYDPADFLGRLPVDGRWANHQEQAFFHAYDALYFATDFHRQLFVKNVLGSTRQSPAALPEPSLRLSGQPHEALLGALANIDISKKRNLILFPHRIAPEKQVEIFRDLQKSLPEYEFVVCQDTKLTKAEYHQLLAESKITFSASLQETMGISSCIEAPILGSLPLLPDRLSYSEVFETYPEFRYPGEWTTDWNSYVENKERLVATIHELMTNYEQHAVRLKTFVNNELWQYTSAEFMYNHLMD